jgi:hypothetical protein
MVFEDKMVYPFWESHVEICGSWPVQALNCHMTTRVVYVTKYKKVYPNLKDNTLTQVKVHITGSYSS